MPPRRATKAAAKTTAVVDENVGIDFSQHKKLQQERDILAEQNINLESQLAALTNKLSQVELEGQKKQKQIEVLKKTKVFEPHIDGLGSQVPSTKDEDGKPKRNLSAYLYYSNAKREQVRTENPKASFGELQKILSEKWKNVSSEESAEFEGLAAADAARYKAEMEQFNKKQNERKEEKSAMDLLNKQQEQEMALELLKQYKAHQLEVEQLTKPKNTEDPNKPKKGTSAYLFFSAQRHKELADSKVPFGDISKQIGEEWSKLSDKERKVFTDMAEQDALRYATEFNEYSLKKQAEEEAAKSEASAKQASLLPEAMKLVEQKKKAEEAMRVLKNKEKDDLALRKEERAAKKALKAAQPKRPGSAYVLWGNEQRPIIKKEHPEATNPEVTKLLAEKWKEVPEIQRAPYQELAKKMMAQYHVDMTKFMAENPGYEPSVTVQTVDDDGNNGDTASSN